MNQILCYDSLPERENGAILPVRDYPPCPTREISSKVIIINPLVTTEAYSVKMAGYWPRSFSVSLWTSTPSWSINTQKKNLANIQPS